MDDFAQCILNDTPSKVSDEEGLRDIRILMAVYESLKTGTSGEAGVVSGRLSRGPWSVSIVSVRPQLFGP